MLDFPLTPLSIDIIVIIMYGKEKTCKKRLELAGDA